MRKQREHFSATIIKCSWKHHKQGRPSSSKIAENEGRLIHVTTHVFDSIDAISSESRSSSAQITEIGGTLVEPTKDALDSIDFVDLDSNLEEINSLSQVSEKRLLEASITDEQA